MDETMLRWEAVENGQPRYLTDKQAALLMREWGTADPEVERIIRERRSWSWKRDTQPLFTLELRPIAWDVSDALPCPSCREAYGVEVRMRGPLAPPPGRGPERIFVCDRCNLTMKDRRRSTRR